MIALSLLPCVDCVYFGGIKQPNGSEIGEYVACAIAKNGKAQELLVYSHGKVTCPRQKLIED